MKYKIYTSLVLSLLIISVITPASQVNAQVFPNAPQSGKNAPPKFYTPQSQSQSQGDGDYSQYYHFGKISVEADPAQFEYQAGKEAEFKGSVVNSNEYAIFDGEIYAQIFLENKKGQSQNGDFVVEQFFLPGKLNLKAGEKLPFSFKYKIPESAQAGNYKIAFFFVIDKKYNMAGLSFLNNSYAGFTNFKVTNTIDKQTSILIDRNNIKFNGKAITQRVVMPQIGDGEKVTYDIPIQNQSNAKKTVTVKETLYFWDGLNEKNKITQKEESITIDPNTSFTYSYRQNTFKEPVYFLIIEAKEQGKDASSIINLRFGTSVNPRARINYSGLDKFPLASGETVTFFTNFHSTANDLAPNSQVEVTLKSKGGETLDKLNFTGDIPGNIQLKKSNFTAESDLNYAVILSTIKNKDGQVVDEGEIILDATKLTGYEKPSTLFDFLFQKSFWVTILILVVLALGAGILIKIKKKQSAVNFPSGPAIFFLLVAATIFSYGLFQSPPTALGEWAESGSSASLTVGPWKIWGFVGQSYLETSKCNADAIDANGLSGRTGYYVTGAPYPVVGCSTRTSYTGDPQLDYEQCVFVPAAYSGSGEDAIYPPSLGESGNGSCVVFDFNNLATMLGPWTNEISMDVSYNVQLTSGNNVFSSGSTNNYLLGAEPINMSFTRDGEWRGTGFGIDSPPAVWMGKYCDGCLDNYKFRDTDTIACTLSNSSPSWMNEPNQSRYYVGNYPNGQIAPNEVPGRDSIYAPLEVEGQNVSISGSGSISCSYDSVYNQYKCQATSGGPGSVTVKVAETKFRQGLYGINNYWGLFHYCTTAKDYERMVLNADASGKTTIYQNDNIAKKYLTIPAYTKTYQFNVIDPLVAPSNLSLSQTTSCPGGTSGINLTWKDNSTNEDSFEIWYNSPLMKDASGSPYFSKQSSVNANVTSTSVSFSSTAEYKYEVRSCKGTKCSDFSNVVSFTPAVACPPTNLVAVASSCSKADLTWTDSSNNEAGFKIQRATSATGPWGADITVPNTGNNDMTNTSRTVSWSDTTVAASTTYYYRVYAYQTGIPISDVVRTSVNVPACSSASAKV
ncbi:MAG: hypothetical protein V1711_01715, partial [bacterium]